MVADVLGELVGRAVPAEADFFEVGGHSLLAARAVARLAEDLGVDLPVREFFATPTAKGLAAATLDQVEDSAGGDLLPSARERR